MRTLVIGDIHGRYSDMVTALGRANYNSECDRLITLGDEVDGGPDSFKVIDYLSLLPNVIKILGNHDCVAEDTEILTDSGWCKIQNYNFNDMVAQYDIKTKEISFDYPEEFIINTPQECVCIEGYDTKQIVSERHEVLINGVKIRAKDLIRTDIKSKSIPNYGYTSNNNGIDLTDDEIRYYTFILMDGCIYETYPNKVRVQFKLSKQRKINKLLTILTNLNIPYTQRNATMSGLNKLQPQMIRIYGSFARTARDYIPLKRMPIEWKNMNKHQLETFLETLLDTDGSKCDGKIVWTSISKNSMDIIQEACIKNGYSTSMNSVENNSGFTNVVLQYKMNIYMSGRYRYPVNISNVGKIRTYCFKMPLGTLVTRIDGKCAITGNCWFINYIKTSVELPIWTHQGGYATLWSYQQENRGKVPFYHAEFLHKARPYYIDAMNRIFIHGGFIPGIPLENQDIETFIWDRQLIQYARSKSVSDFSHVYVGHTTTLYYDSLKPITFNNLTMMDTGAGWPGGYLSVMDIDTKEVWQSDMII